MEFFHASKSLALFLRTHNSFLVIKCLTIDVFEKAVHIIKTDAAATGDPLCKGSFNVFLSVLNIYPLCWRSDLSSCQIIDNRRFVVIRDNGRMNIGSLVIHFGS